jgi:hypothetical protein
MGSYLRIGLFITIGLPFIIIAFIAGIIYQAVRVGYETSMIYRRD